MAEEEKVFTVREVELAQRKKLIDVSQAEAEADASRIRAMAAKIRHEVEAEGLTLMNKAANLLTPEARQSAMRRQLIDKLEGIIRESVKPMERIEGIKVLHVEGLGGGQGGGNGSGNGNIADSVVNSALRFAPRRRWSISSCARSACKAATSGAHDAAGRQEALIKVYTSSVIDAPADQVWAQVRDFNGLPVDAVRR